MVFRVHFCVDMRRDMRRIYIYIYIYAVLLRFEMRRDMRGIYICGGSDTNLVTAPALYVWDVVWWFMRGAICIYICILKQKVFRNEGAVFASEEEEDAPPGGQYRDGSL